MLHRTGSNPVHPSKKLDFLLKVVYNVKNGRKRFCLIIYLEDFQMTNAQPDKIVYIGRFRPAHKAHIETVERACMIAKDSVIIIVGSANQPRTIKNPWKWDEVADMVRASLSPTAREKVVVLPARDILYNDPAWEQSIQEIVSAVTDEDDIVNIIGCNKDETSYYIEAFPQWETIEMENIDDLHATDIRRAMFEDLDFDKEIGKFLPKGIHDYIKSFMLTPEYDKLVKEYEFQLSHDRMWNMNKMLDYFMERELSSFSAGEQKVVETTITLLRNNYKVAPYEPTFNTVDLIIIKAGHVLLARRKHYPGMALYAIPGGYLNPKEWSIDGAMRECKEETKIKEPPMIIRSNIKANHVFEHPERSIRGRVITRAYISQLPTGGPLPKITAADDAERVRWVPLSVFAKMEDQMFEDHFHIINAMIAKLDKEGKR